MVSSYAFYDTNDNFTLVQLIDSIGNVNHAVSIFGKWIFDSNFRKALPF